MGFFNILKQEKLISACRNLPSTILISNSKVGDTYSVYSTSKSEEIRLWKSCLEQQTNNSFINHDGSLNYLPNEIQIENTSRCNLRCYMCPQSLELLNDTDLGLANFAKILRNMTNSFFKKNFSSKSSWNRYRLIIQGTGEPLMDGQFFSMVSLATDFGFKRIQTTSNGLLLTKRNCNLVYDSGLSSLTISIDSPRKKEYEEIRIGGNFNKLIKNLDYLCNHNHRNNLQLNFSVTLHPSTLKYVKEIIYLSNYFKVNSLTISFDLVFWGQSEIKKNIAHERECLMNSYETYRTLIHEAKNLDCELFILMPVSNIENSKGFCPYFINSVNIRVDGNVVPCCRLREDQNYFMGNSSNDFLFNNSE